MERKIRVGITHGDINGIGYEVILKTFSDPTMLELCTPIIYGSPKIATFHRKALDLPVNFRTIKSGEEIEDGKLNMVDCFDDQEVKVDYGKNTPEAGLASLVSLDFALKDYEQGYFDVLVTAPVNKHSIQTDQFHFAGHTEYLEEKYGDEEHSALMMLIHDKLRVALATTHLPVKDIAQTITKDLIKEKATLLHDSLVRDFSISNPRIAVLALNPHAGDECLIGMEEVDKIGPAIKELSEQGIQCFGPYSSDSFFGSGKYNLFDATLCMFHDQGLIAFKSMTQGEGVNYTAGLNIIRTAPVHGCAYDIAGKNLADENSFRQSIYVAIDIYRNQLHNDFAARNPLRKVFRDKRDDSDKLKLD